MRVKVDIKAIKQYLHKTRLVMEKPADFSPPEKKIKVNPRTVDKQHWRSKLNRNFDEKDVGIIEFIGHNNAFTGVIKNRYEDFVVHEITKTGEIVRLTDCSAPQLDTQTIIDIHDVLDEDVVENIQKLSYDLKDNKRQKQITGESLNLQTNNEAKSLEITKKSETADDSVKINVTNKEKSERGQIHKAIRDNFPNLDSSTIDETNEKFIIVSRIKAGPRRIAWLTDKGEYVHFSLYKENIDTQNAINQLSSKLHISAKNFTYAGTKDKRAITTQRVSAWKVAPNKLLSAIERMRDIKVGNFSFEKSPLKLGDLSGNHFDIALRDVEYDDQRDVENALQSASDTGFINYFGMQRFGFNYDKPYSVGLLVLQQKWKEVVETLLTPKSKDVLARVPNFMSLNQCLEMWQNTRDARKVYKNLLFKTTLEGMLLCGLTKVATNDYQGALCSGLHRNHRLFPLHCLQSYLWNCIASYRIKTYGTKVVIGDLFTKNSYVDYENMELNTDTEDEKDINHDIYYVDENNIKNLSIHDVVIPLIGSSTFLPKNSTADYINSLLSEEGITMDMFHSLPKQWSCEGRYRKLLAKPTNFTWQWINYTDPNKPLIKKDVENVNSAIKPGLLITSGSQQIETLPVNVIEHNMEETDTSINILNEPYLVEKLALILSFELPSSCYATIMIREITKSEPTDLEIKPWLSRVGAHV